MRINLTELYNQINSQLKGTSIPNDGAKFKTILFIPDDEVTGKMNPVELQFESMALENAIAGREGTIVLNLKLARALPNVNKRT